MKAILKSYLTLVGIAAYKKPNDHTGGKYKLVQPLWGSVGRLLRL